MQQVDLKFGALIIRGDDRAKFLHNFCTADVKQMAFGDIREAFVLNTKGKLVGITHIWCRANQLELWSWPDQTATLREHLERYVIREKVDFDIAPIQYVRFYFRENDEVVQTPFPGTPLKPNTFQQLSHSDGSLEIARGEFCGPGWILRETSGQWPIVETDAGECQFPQADFNTLEAHRIRHRFPRFGSDADIETLPQELQRDRQAISFDKGCYLGQETVARIDALGHVNRALERVQLAGQPEGDLPIALRMNDSSVGQLTSLAFDRTESSWIGLAMLKRTACKPGLSLDAEGTSAVIW